jgi:hypothetical protein
MERRLKFLPATTGEYALYYGNPDAKRPAYDLGTILQRTAPTPEFVLAAGAEQTNPAYHPPPPPLKPWSDRHPAVLYGALGASILAMGYVTIRFLMAVKNRSA